MTVETTLREIIDEKNKVILQLQKEIEELKIIKENLNYEVQRLGRQI